MITFVTFPPNTGRTAWLLSVWAFRFSFITLLLLLAGCMQKVQVTYNPTKTGQVQKEMYRSGGEDAATTAAYSVEKSGKDAPRLNGYFQRWKGVKYRYGGSSTKGVDCSGLVQRTYKDLYNVDLPRTAASQSKTGRRIDKKSLRPGDLVFFKTGLFSRHVGIYLGKNRFIHASRSKGVTQSNLNNTYWRSKYWQAKRYSSVSS